MVDLEVRNLNPAFGAQVTGLEPRIPINEEARRLLRAAFDEQGLLVFRDWDIDADFQRHLVGMLIGEDDAYEYTNFVSNKEKGGYTPYGRLLFHSDMMASDHPCEVLSLYGMHVEQPSIPTIFASAAYAWGTLPDELRARVVGMHAVHGHDTTYPNRGGDDDVADSVFDLPQMTTKPVALRNPRTGRTLLYVSQQVTREIIELSPEENEQVLEALFAHLYDPANLVQHEWRTGDLVVWDNLAVQHARPNVQLEGPTRTLRKVFAPKAAREQQIPAPRFSKAR